MRPSSELPQLPNSNILGTLPRLSKDPLNFFDETLPYDSPIVKFRLAHKSYFYIKDPLVLQEALMASLVQRYNWKLVEGYEEAAKAGATLYLHPHVEMVLNPRY